MKCRNEQFQISIATPEDSRQLLAIYECGDFKGDISVLYTRRPDPYRSLLQEGEKAIIPIVTDKENGVIVGMGACIIRKAWINGEVKSTGYLTGLKGLPDYRKRVPSITEVYRYLYELTRDEVDIYYTTILKENIQVQKMLEKKRKNMPEYRSTGEYTVYCFRTGSRIREKGGKLEKGTLSELERLYQETAGNFNFSAADQSFYGLRDEDVYILRGQEGEALAACAVWNQQSYKQYIITQYGGIYKYLKNLPVKWLGYPELPKENVPANYGGIAMLFVKNNDLATAEYFIRKVAEEAREYGFLMLGLFENHPLGASMDPIRSIRYQSKLYTVHWADSILELDMRPVDLQVGLL